MSWFAFPGKAPALAACVLALAGLSGPSVASAETPATGASWPAEGTPTAGSELEDPSVLSLVAEYGITIEQARAQMETQVEAGRAERDLPSELSMVYSGRQVSHDRMAAVAVAIADATRASAIRDHFAGYGIENLDVRAVASTRTDIHGLIEQLSALLRAGRPDGSSPMIEFGNRSLGMVTVRVADGELNTTEAGIVGMALASPEIYQLAYVDHLPRSDEEACDFVGDIECDPPLRGSVRITEGRPCSAGFIARSLTDGKPNVLTAGHCDDGAGNWQTRFANGEAHIIGPFHNSRNDLITDTGIIRVNNPTGWQFGRPYVTVDPTGGEPAHETYLIDDVLNPGLGDRVCATLGNTARTDCGEVTDTNVSGGGTDGLFEVDDLCTNDGDSGSPYFASHIAYGVHSSGDGVDGTTGCLFGRAEHALEASSRMNVYIVEA